MIPRRVAIIGAGVAGLAAARALSEHCEVVVFEASARAGGKLTTEIFRNNTVDLGADSFITRNSSAVELCKALGLSEELTEPKGGFAALFSHAGLTAFPTGLAIGIPTSLKSLSKARVVSRASLARAALDYLLPGRVLSDSPIEQARAGGHDPSVAEVVGSRLGRGVLDALVDPFVGGINASDVEVLSFAAALPDLATRAGGSRVLMRGLRPPARPVRTASPDSAFFGLSSGISSLTDALVSDLHRRGVSIHTSAPVTGLRTDGEGYQLETDTLTETFDSVVLSLPATKAAELVKDLDAELSDELAGIEYSSVVTAALAFSADAVPAATTARLHALSPDRGSFVAYAPLALPGNGVLVPRHLGRLITAITFFSSKWPGSANPGEVVLKVSSGRHRDARALEMSDEDLIRAFCSDLSTVLGMAEAPLESRVVRFPNSFPQYTSGHLHRVARIDALVKAHSNLALAGAAYRGIGIPACIDSGNLAAEQLLETSR